MKHLILQQFWESIPQEKIEHVRRKLPYYLKKLTEERGNISNMPKGFYARRIRGTADKYKFRMANDDRVLFSYADDMNDIRMENKGGIVLLAYYNHDEQIRKGRNFCLDDHKSFSEYDFELEGYDEETESVTFSEMEVRYAALTLMMDHTRAYQVEDTDLARMAQEGVKDWQYYLNHEQYYCVQIHDRPVFLSGGAGTGKSTIGLHKLFALSKNKDANLVYFTYTKTLKNDFKKMFDAYQIDYKKNNPKELLANIEFHSFNEFCIAQVGKKIGNLVDFRKFENEFAKENWPLFHNLPIHKVDIWQEIRGLIKGFMGRYWLRNEIFDNVSQKVNGETLDFLIRHNFVKEIEKDHYMILQHPNSLFSGEENEWIVDLLVGEEFGRKNILTGIRNMKRRMEEERFSSPLIPKEIYLSLEDEDCVFSKDERIQIYRIGEKYQTWLENEKKFDENDVARKLLIMIKDGSITPSYDYIMVDEVQDLSELQIYLLLSLKRQQSHFNDFFFSGDIHQMINPTYFSFSRLRMPFHYQHAEKELQLLEKNYRSQAHIVALGNKMGELCKTYIGAKDNFSSIPLQEPGKLPFWLMPSEKNEQELFSILERKDRKYAIIIVPDEKEKKRIATKMGTAERVFTVQEIKGLEYDYVVCVNMLTPFLEEWQEIMAGRGKKNAKYRYYFNIFYVALTRAKQNLCIYEEDIEHPLLLEIREYLTITQVFDADVMALKRSANRQEVLHDARNQERLGNYEAAIQGYYDIKDWSGVLRCEGKTLREQGLHADAIKKFLAAGEEEEAWNLAEEVENDYLRLLVLLQISKNPVELETMFAKPLSVIHEVIAQAALHDEFIELVYDKYLRPKWYEYQKKCDDCLHGIEMVKREFASDE